MGCCVSAEAQHTDSTVRRKSAGTTPAAVWGSTEMSATGGPKSGTVSMEASGTTAPPAARLAHEVPPESANKYRPTTPPNAMRDPTADREDAVSVASGEECHHGLKFVPAMDRSNDTMAMHALLDEYRAELGESLAETTMEPGELSKAMKQQYLVSRANWLHNINADPNQFTPENELPRGREKRKLCDRVVDWQGETKKSELPPTSFGV